MRHTKLALTLLAAAVLSACGGSDNDTPAPAPKPTFASQVVFGDSLSDVGTYKVGTVAALGGGKYTINGATSADLSGKNWTELTAATFKVAAPCAAVTGLDGAAASGFSVPVVQNTACTNYAQGGARVTNPVGPGNKLTGSPLGQLTQPLTAQVANHLSRNGGKFSGNEVVIVMAGGNDALILLAGLTAAATAEGTKVGGQTYISTLVPLLAAGATNPTTAAAAIGAAAATEAARAGSTQTTITQVAVGTAAAQPGNAAVGSAAVYGPMVAQATTAATTAGNTAAANYASANGPALVPQMAQAGSELATLIRNEIVGKGANYVVLNNLPDLAGSPSGKSQSASAQQLIAGMVNAFNIALRVGIDGLEAKVLPVDVYTVSVDQVANPSKYGFTNVTTPACGNNALSGSSLVCNASNVIAGDVSKYMFADTVHPTPYANTLIAKTVQDAMIARGWL